MSRRKLSVASLVAIGCVMVAAGVVLALRNQPLSGEFVPIDTFSETTEAGVSMRRCLERHNIVYRIEDNTLMIPVEQHRYVLERCS